MAQLINIGFGNMVNGDKIISMVSTDAAPIKRMIQNARDEGSGGGCHLREEDTDGAYHGERTSGAVGAHHRDHSHPVQERF